jgi:hypothetical protein
MTDVFAIAPLTTFEEVFEWGTTVIGCRNSESLESYKEQPVYYANYTFNFRSVEEFTYAKALAERIGLDIFYLPLWHLYALFPAITAGVSSISCILSFIEYPVEEKTFLLFESPANWEVVTIAGVSDTIFTLTAPVSRDFTKAWLVPLVKGFLTEGVSFSDSSGSSFSAKLSFRGFYRYAPTTFPVIPDYFAEYPVLDLPLQTSTTIEHRYAQAFEMAASDLGLSEILKAENYARQNYSFTISTQQKEEVKTLKDTLSVLKGRAELFWFPTKTKDIRLKDSTILAGAVTLVTYPTKLPSVDRYILLRTKAGKYYLKISTITSIDYTTDHILIDTPPTEDIIDIYAVEFLHLVRLNSDSITFAYKNKKICSVALTAITSNKHINALYPPKYSLRTQLPLTGGIWTAKDSDHIFIEGEGTIYSYSLSTGLLTPIITGIPHKDPGSGVRFGGIVSDGTFIWELHWDSGNPGIAKYTKTGTLVNVCYAPMTGVPIMLAYSPYGILTYTSELSMYRVSFSGVVETIGTAIVDTGLASMYFDGVFLWAVGGANLYKILPTTLEVLATIPLSLNLGATRRYICLMNGYIWVTNPSAQTLSKISRSSGIILATYPLGYSPIYITALASGFLAISCSDNNIVLLVNPLIGTVMGSISSPSPGEVIEGSDGKLYIPNTLTNTLSVY